MPTYEVTFESPGFTRNRGIVGNEFSESEAEGYTEVARAEGTLPAGVIAVLRGHISEDDGQSGAEVRVFACVTLRLQAADAEEAESFVPPEGLLTTIADLMGSRDDEQHLSLDGGAWEAAEIEEAGPVASERFASGR